MTALELIKKGWTQGELARNDEGYPVNPNSPMSVCWCSTGAIWAAHPEFEDRQRACAKFLSAIDYPSITGWNDAPERTHADVIAAFEKAGI
jgi:hypothetical protein